MPVSQSSKPPRLMSSTFPLLPSSAGVPAPHTIGMSDAAQRERSSMSGRGLLTEGDVGVLDADEDRHDHQHRRRRLAQNSV